MGPRPAHLELTENDLPRPPRRTFHVDLPSPRTGEAPPALSPLDAFAMQSRLLAKRFEQQDEDGRRISRLPHQDVAKEFGPRPGFFRAVSEEHPGTMRAAGMTEVPELNEEANPSRPTTSAGIVEKPYERPVSHYPTMGDASRQSRAGTPPPMPFTSATRRAEAPIPFRPPVVSQDYFGMVVPRASSPETLNHRFANATEQQPSSANMPSLSNSIDTLPSTQARKTTNGSQRSQQSHRSVERNLLPPHSPRFPKSPRSFQSIRSVRQDSGDDDAASLNGYSQSSRKFSGSSMSRPHSPFSPLVAAPPDRSPSILSDHSFTTNSQFLPQRPQFANFSRPMSSASFNNTRISLDSRPSMDLRPSNDLSLREPSVSNLSINSNPSQTLSRQNSDDDSRRMRDDAATADSQKEDGSYTYAKYALPRGRALERDSVGQRTSWINHQFSAWDAEQATAAQSSTPAKSLHGPDEPGQQVDAQGLSTEVTDPTLFERPPRRRDLSPAGSEKFPERRSSRIPPDVSGNTRPRSMEPRVRNSSHGPTPSVATESTERTIRAAPLHERNPSAELTPEEHLDIGIQAHDAGQLSKSTYHLRLAARAGLPTAMLLYALACRHGWGMRPNQEDGVMWLRRAIEGSQLELSDLEAAIPTSNRKLDQAGQIAERRKRKAQFALAIYELGISYMNGWGCTKDRALAVRCYEVAGSWGDCDALAEAGFCYAQGQGVKKDLKKAAALYRKAAEGGMSMAGNSWIYKAKYMDADSTPAASQSFDRSEKRPGTSHGTKDKDKDGEREKGKEKDGEKTPAGRTRSRSIWSRKKDKDKS